MATYPPPSELIAACEDIRDTTKKSYLADVRRLEKKTGMSFYAFLAQGPSALEALYPKPKELRGRMSVVCKILRLAKHPMHDEFCAFAKGLARKMAASPPPPARDESVPSLDVMRACHPLGTTQRVYVELGYTGVFRNGELEALCFAPREPDGLLVETRNYCLVPDMLPTTVLINDGKMSSRTGARQAEISPEAVEALYASFEKQPRLWVFPGCGGDERGRLSNFTYRNKLPAITYLRKHVATANLEEMGVAAIIKDLNALTERVAPLAANMGHGTQVHFANYAGQHGADLTSALHSLL